MKNGEQREHGADLAAHEDEEHRPSWHVGTRQSRGTSAEAAIVVASLAALTGRGGETAVETLRAMAERAVEGRGWMEEMP